MALEPGADPPGRSDDPADRGKRARLPGPVRPDECRDRTLRGTERDSVDRFDRAVADAQVIDLEQSGGQATSSVPR